MPANKLNYRIKLLSGNNVVLIEANGFESEIFMPHVANGRLSFMNIIPNRRCCQLMAHHPNGGGNSLKSSIKNETSAEALMPHPTTTTRLCRMSTTGKENISSQLMRPLANSTPAMSGTNSTNNIRVKARDSSMLMTPSTFGSAGQSTLPTPEPFRKAAPRQQQLIENTLHNLPRCIKVMRLYHNSRDGTPSKVGRLVSSNNMGNVTRQDLLDISNLSCSFRISSTSASSGRSFFSSTPLNKRMPAPTLPGSSNSKWRKCKTPIKTYSKRGAAVKSNVSMSALKRASKPVRPTYLINPTQAPQPSHSVEVRRRKLVVDGKVRMSSRTMKRHQHEQNAQYQTNHKTIVNPTVSFTALQKKRKTPMSAFDMLTNSNRARSMTAKLNELFRRGCVNKASSTYGKYKLLCSIPPLQEDEQVLELTQAELPSFSNASAGQIPQVKLSGNAEIVSRSTSAPKTTSAPLVLNSNPKNQRPVLHNGQRRPKVVQQPVRYVLQ